MFPRGASTQQSFKEYAIFYKEKISVPIFKPG
ncbi:hypothetical protein EYZ11_011023 [Aspergillus tanneri]|uniref:Uncharacterized protein n=1 Tax=Aspergillus tanneri TaxID=1220188 RepID=A0A4V3UN22_9EURO|nr:hypothetical protein EYZ11_011023 [Aspergillus tanneri]